MFKFGDHAAGDKLPLHKIPGKLSILPFLGRLDGIPQSFAFPEFFGSVVRCHHFGVDDTGFAREVVTAVQTLVIEPGS